MRDKAIIMDLDGTAIDSPDQKLPSDRLVAAVAALKDDYYLCAATGRVWSFAQPVLQKLRLDDPSVISAGTQICDPRTGEIMWQQTIADRALRQVIEVFKKYPDWKLIYNDATEEDYFHGGVYPPAFQRTESVYFLEQVFVPDDTAKEIEEQLKVIAGVTCIAVHAQKPGKTDLHVIHQEATKEHAIEQLLSMLGVAKERTIGVGDGNNDLDLFNGVGRKIAMGNAVDALKAEADEQIGRVDEDGLAQFLEKLKRD